MPFTIVRNDIVNMEVDAIVNSTGSLYSRLGGVEAKILHRAGTKLIEDRKRLGEISTTEARFTSAPNLPAKFIIHTVGPRYNKSVNPEKELRSTYQNALQLANDLNVESIAFPLISSGTYEYPKKEALLIAQDEILRFLENNEMMIYLVVYDKESFTVSQDFQDDIMQFIDTGVIQREQNRLKEMRPFREIKSRKRHSETAPMYHAVFDEIDDVEEGFSKVLLKLIDKTGQKDSYVYKKANIDRKLFSKIRNNPHYRPSKNTIIAFAIALELSLKETNDLLSKAGYVLTRSILFDVVIITCIKRNMYDIYEVNNHLYKYDQELLGSK